MQLMAKEKNEYLEIGYRLTHLRQHYGMSQREWAARHGFNPSQYSNWEAGIRRISLPSAYMLCDKYGLTLDFIYRGKMDGLSKTASQLFSSM